MSRILFIAPTRIGDAILATGPLAWIEQHQPEIQLTIATSSLSAPLFAHHPQLQRLIIMDKMPRGAHWLKLWRNTCSIGWSAVWDMRSSALAYVLPTKSRIIYKADKERIHKVLQFERRFKRPLPSPKVWTSIEDEKTAATLLPSDKKYVIIAPIANWDPKEWPILHFISLCEALFSPHGIAANYQPIIACAPHEASKAAPLIKALTAHSPICFTDGSLSLSALYACFKRVHLFIGNDSGLMHMAAAANIPTLGLLGPTAYNADMFYPWGAKNAMAIAPDSSDFSSLTVDMVMSKLSQMMP